MKTKWFAMLIAFCMLVALASAQPYSIRANRGLNLRAAPSLNADIADTVPSGSILQVIGRSGEWLQIDHNGREVWLADWVNFSRDDESATAPNPQPVTSAAPANVDNCCFVDRQCSSDQEWTDGYWAFQNGQCAAPAQPQPVTHAQPGASALANVDNCCNVDRQCQHDWEWTEGYWAYQTGQCTAPALSQPVTRALPTARELATGGNCCSSIWNCLYEWDRVQGYYAYQLNQCAGLPQTSAITLTGPVPRIEGSDQFVSHVLTTLKWMKSIAPAWYNYVITGMNSIVEVPVPNTGVEQICTARAYARERRVTLESCWTWDPLGISEFALHSAAVALAHEACHIHTHEEGIVFANQEHEEAECRKFGTGVSVLFSSAISVGMSPRNGVLYWCKDRALNELRSFCSHGYRADLFCPTLQELESKWTNVPYEIFPPGAPEMMSC